jgi:hypothetical protein
LPFYSRFSGSNPANGNGFLRSIKIGRNPSVEGAVKPEAPYLEILQHVKNPFQM